MPLVAKSAGDGFNFELIPAGNHVARCYMVCDLGEHEQEYQGQKSIKRKVRLAFECPDELMSEGDNEGRPFSVSKEYTLSLHEKAALYKDLVGWRGKPFTPEELDGFDLENLAGVPCMVNVVHKTSAATGNTYPSITSISKVPKGLTMTDQVNDSVIFSTDNPDARDAVLSLPEWLQGKINLSPISADAASDAYQQYAEQGQDLDDDIPF